MIEDLFYTYELRILKKYCNEELKLHQYFLQKTNIIPENIIIIEKFLFFFIKNNDYFQAKTYLKQIRADLSNRKILIARAEKTIVRLLMALFPDVYIHDIELEVDEETGDLSMKVYLLSFEQRGIAIGRNGNYIKAVNTLFSNYIFPVKINCEYLDFKHQIRKVHYFTL